jgi:hypothetical protein
VSVSWQAGRRAAGDSRADVDEVEVELVAAAAAAAAAAAEPVAKEVEAERRGLAT